MSSKVKTELLPMVRVTSGTREMIKREAAKHNITMAEYIRRCIWLGRRENGHVRGRVKPGTMLAQD